MDLNNVLFIILVQILLVFSQETKSNEAGSSVKHLTEKACEYANDHFPSAFQYKFG